MKPKIPNAVRAELAMRIKNKIDISDLIAPYSIANEDLSGAIIKDFQRVGEDISNLNLTNAVIGTENAETHISRAIAYNGCFKNARFLGKVIAKKTNFTNSNFTNAYLPYCDYRFAKFNNCIFCGAVFSMSTELSLGAEFSDNFFRDLGKCFNLTITVNKPGVVENT